MSETIRILVTGDSGTGNKTCFLRRFHEGKFDSCGISTVGIDYFVAKMRLPTGQLVRSHCWDTAGQERFRTITTAYYPGCMGIITGYDVTDRDSFQNVSDYWVPVARRNCSENVPIVIVGNKIDMVTERKVSREEGEAQAARLGCPYFEVSAKQDIGICEAVLRCMLDVLANGFVDKGLITREEIKMTQTFLTHGSLVSRFLLEPSRNRDRPTTLRAMAFGGGWTRDIPFSVCGARLQGLMKLLNYHHATVSGDASAQHDSQPVSCFPVEVIEILLSYFPITAPDELDSYLDELSTASRKESATKKTEKQSAASNKESAAKKTENQSGCVIA